MAKDTKAKKKKKDVYPSKRVINLYFKEDKTSHPATMVLYGLFGIVLLLAFAKFLVVDLITDLNIAEKTYEQNLKNLNQYTEAVKDYKDVVTQYNRYSDSFLNDNEILCDRIDILEMLEETIFVEGKVSNITISSNTISVNLTGVDLEQTAILKNKIEGYPIVKSVSVSTASYGGNYSARMTIIVTEEVEETEAGGDQ